jgi:ribA/ribD-fused uncharacterized protein
MADVLMIAAGDASNPLSNFNRCRIAYGGLIFPSVEHAFHAQRTEVEADRLRIRMARSPADARRVGESLHPRIGWDKTRVSVMHELLTIKFGERSLADKLVATGDKTLVVSNEWNDRFWGLSGTEGDNWLGRLLADVRDAVRVRLTNEQVSRLEEIPASTQKEIEAAAISREAGERAHYIQSFAMHVLMLQGKLDILVEIRNGCRGKGSAVERRMLERRILGLSHGISRSGQVWIALMTGKLKPWVVGVPGEKEEAKEAA